MFRYHAILTRSFRHECDEYHPWFADLKRGLRYVTFDYTDHSPDLVLNSIPGARWWRVGVKGTVLASSERGAVSLCFAFDWSSVVKDNKLELK